MPRDSWPRGTLSAALVPSREDGRLGVQSFSEAGDDRFLDLTPYERNWRVDPEVALDHPTSLGRGSFGNGPRAIATEELFIVNWHHCELTSSSNQIYVIELRPRQLRGIDYPSHDARQPAGEPKQ